MSSTAQSRPETFRLPKPGAGDPYFGITRGGYYQGEVDGWWTLIRLKRPGMKRGITLVPFAEVEAFISKQRKQQNGGAQPAVGKSDYSSGEKSNRNRNTQRSARCERACSTRKTETGQPIDAGHPKLFRTDR